MMKKKRRWEGKEIMDRRKVIVVRGRKKRLRWEGEKKDDFRSRETEQGDEKIPKAGWKEGDG